MGKRVPLEVNVANSGRWILPQRIEHADSNRRTGDRVALAEKPRGTIEILSSCSRTSRSGSTVQNRSAKHITPLAKWIDSS